MDYKTLDYIEKFNKAHNSDGNNIYDYSLINNIKNIKTEISVICKIHGLFKTKAGIHKTCKCPKCAIDIAAITRRQNKALVFFDKCKIKHNNEYIYLSEYKGIKENITIECKIHGQFEQQAIIHKNGSGCPYCAGQKLSKDDVNNLLEKFKYRTDDIIEYKTIDYSFICDKNHKFNTSISKLQKGMECFECSYITRNNTLIHRGYRIDPSLKSDFQTYTQKVWKHTNSNIKKYNLENIHLRSQDYHVDHIYSIAQGFKNNIPIYLISNINNLRILDASINKQKQTRCDIDIETLLKRSTTILIEEYTQVSGNGLVP